ncbi:acyl-CoA thioester hydrolase/BAAT C-terminal domain-containing protein [Viridibacillus arvi]|uniref:acyl-CoA thioester hydrolase/BAAT C-terminal domain-containing protein n=1 Tax=Viridibacillus arvi TaxID=263475 RepID=UPI00381778C0
MSGSILLISGEEDVTCNFSKIAIDRLDKSKSAHYYKHFIYPGAGHSIGIPNVYINQGNKKETAFASLDSWKRTIAFYYKSIESVNK